MDKCDWRLEEPMFRLSHGNIIGVQCGETATRAYTRSYLRIDPGGMSMIVNGEEEILFRCEKHKILNVHMKILDIKIKEITLEEAAVREVLTI